MSTQQTVDSKQPESSETIDERYAVSGHGLQIIQRDEHYFAVWLNIQEDSDQDGLCIGVGDTRPAAIEQASKSLEALVAHLNFLQTKHWEASE